MRSPCRPLNIAMLLAAAVLPACSNESPTAPPVPTVIQVTQTVTQTQGGGTTTASPSPGAGACLAVDSVGCALLGGTGAREATLRPNQSIPLDTTGRSGGQLRPPACDDLSRVTWSMLNSPVGACTIANDTTHTPTVTARLLGTCEFRSNIDGVPASNVVTITVSNSAPAFRPDLPFLTNGPPAGHGFFEYVRP